MPSLEQKRYVPVLIKMDGSLDNFKVDGRLHKFEDVHEQFKADLARVAAYPAEEIKNHAWWDGCVFYNARIPMAGAIFLLEMFKLSQYRDDVATSEEMVVFSEFIKKYSILSISSPLQGALEGVVKAVKNFFPSRNHHLTTS